MNKKRAINRSLNILCAHLGSNQGPNDYESFAANQLSYKRICCPCWIRTNILRIKI